MQLRYRSERLPQYRPSAKSHFNRNIHLVYSSDPGASQLLLRACNAFQLDLLLLIVQATSQRTHVLVTKKQVNLLQRKLLSLL